MSTRPLNKFVVTSLLWGCAASLALAADWPAYKHDTTRSSVSTEQISTQLKSSWTWHGAAPKPAWGEPGRSFNPLDFDYAPQPVVANGIVFLASSADDSVRAFDATSGELKWAYTCDAPVRFAPQIVGNQCFFAADDGIARCLDAATGEELWKKQLALNGSQVIANGRLSSRWPCRSGVLVKDEKVFVTAGMWPSEGVYIFCLEAKTGKELWCNDTSCYEYLEYPHVPSVSFGGAAPQGALLATDDTLVVPTGRGVPAGYDLATGRLLHYRADSEVAHKGGTWATVVDSTVFVNAVGWMPDVPPRLGESPEHFADSLMAVSARTGKEEWKLSTSMKAIAKEWQGTRWRGQISAGIYGRTRAIITDKAIYAFGNGKADAYDVAGSNVTLRWSMPLSRVYAEALCANQLIIGMDGGCSALDPVTGKQLWTQTVSGQVRGLAIAEERVFATTSLGALHVFSTTGTTLKPTTPSAKPLAATPLPANVQQALKELGTTKGFALVLGGKDARLAQSLAASSSLNVVQLLLEPKVIAQERARLLSETTDYGHRISVLDASKQPLPPYFASLVVLVGDRACVTPAEGYRVLRPCGGVLCAANGALPTIPDVLPEEKRGDIIIRGQLPRSFDWDGKVEADERVRWPLEFSWFGEPSSQLQKARHTRPRSPLPAHGRLFIFGENTVTAVDAYSGTVLWKRRLNDSIGKDAPIIANDTSFSCSLGSAVATFDAASGKLREVYSDKPLGTPIIDATKPVHLTGAMRPGASCEVEIDSTASELRFILTAKNNAPQLDDAWELAFDFRQPEQRLNAPGPGTFELVVNVWNASLRPHPSFPHPAATLAALEPGKIQLSFAWADIATFAGWKPTNFSLAADCKLWSPKLDLLLWDRPLTNGKTRGINDAEAIVVVSTNTGSLFPLQLRSLAESPIKDLKASANGLPLLAQRRPNADLSDFGAAGVAADPKEAQKTFLPRATGFEFPTRNEPFTGTTAELDYTPSYGCSGIISSATMDFLRSGCIGMYDRDDDSGMRNISGIRSGCGQTIMPALGMLLYAEGTGNCLCTYNYATSFGMAPTDQRRNEDWALFNDAPKDTIGLSHVAFNLGAPGDRRADDGTLWLAIPRPGLGLKMGTAIPLPVTLEYTHGDGPQRINTDRNKILFTDKPWIYGSNVTGIKNLHVDLTYYKPGGVCLSVGTIPPTIDGNLNDACWDGFGGAAVGKDYTVWVRHDADHLYLASKPSGDGKSGPLNLTFADTAEHKLISLTATGAKVTAKAMEIPPYDPKASFSSLPEVPAVEIELPGVNLAGKGNYELAIPWKTFTALGLDAAHVRISGNPISFFGRKPPDIKRNFSRTAFAVKPLSTAPTEASYTLRLHFCEIGSATTTTSNRVFDVLINGKPVLEKFDLTKDVGRNKAVMKEFKHVTCGGSLDVEFRPEDKSVLPVLSGIEIIRE